ncbi:hypothetical protein FGO68_gene9447 [Halteria grandinella]|uniref:Actin-related protein 6 n=1 Tax=Halteria grandinella TaxID=5974 RepID=A0A8J8P0B6_HALGN|nr:hypothetical protein FGO68_gene9447 [Halteria grandinella]
MCASGAAKQQEGGLSNTWRDNLSKRLVLDHGAYMIKYSSASEAKPQLMYNAVGKDKKNRNVYVGNKLWDELEGGHANIQVTYPMVRGLLHDSDVETVIWKQIFSRFKKLEERASCLALTLPPILPEIVQTRFTEVAFEDFEFDALFMSSTHSMIREAAVQEIPDLGEQCQLVVDSGFSFTYGLPFFDSKPMRYAATRLDVGGKLLTNLLNEQISYKEVNLQGETHLVNDMKEQLSYVAKDFQEEMDICQQKVNPIVKEFVLPDYKGVKKGYPRDPVTFLSLEEQLLAQKAAQQEQDEYAGAGRKIGLSTDQAVRIGSERFSVPEVLFHPSDIGINEAGLPEMINQVISKCPKPMERPLYANIVIAGGNAHIKGIRERLELDMQSIKPYDSEVRIFELQNPSQAAWRGLKQFCSNKANFEDFVVTRKEYLEEGGSRVLKKLYL